jgi:hypothetical protein
MDPIERRDVLKIAGAAAVATALTTGASCPAKAPAGLQPRIELPEKIRKATGDPKKWFGGSVDYVLASDGPMFTFGINMGRVGKSFLVDPKTNELAVRIVMMAYEKGLSVTVYEDSAPFASVVYI